MSKISLYTFLFLLGFLLFYACETVYQPDTSQYPVEYVVEGYIELANENVPTLVYLSRTLPFYDTIDETVITESFVRDAMVTVSKDGGEPTQLTEICLDEVDTLIAQQIRELLLVNGAFGNLCLYIDLIDEIEKSAGSEYSLIIQVGEDRITSSTMILDTIPVDTLFHELPAGNVQEGFFDFTIQISDPENEVNYYRVLTGVNDRPLYSNNNSVFDDVFFEGKQFSFPVPRPVYPDEDIELDSLGLYRSGDTVHLKWMNMDQEHYNFWSSLEFDSNNGGPFATYTRASSNIEGGLGIWGGFAANYYDYIIP